MTTDVHLRCEVPGTYDRDPVWCPVMLRSLNSDEKRGHGFAELVIFNVNDGRQRVAGVVLRTKKSDPGLCLNFCCWCGANIMPVESETST